MLFFDFCQNNPGVKKLLADILAPEAYQPFDELEMKIQHGQDFPPEKSPLDKINGVIIVLDLNTKPVKTAL